MSQAEEKIVKIVDEASHTRGASVEQMGSRGALIVKALEGAPTDPLEQNASFAFSNEDEVVSSTMTITKSVGGSSYSRIFSYNAAGDLISISIWQENE